MLTHSDFCEENVPYYTPFPVADPVRGRVALKVTHHRIGADLDRERLDREAPLPDGDCKRLSQYTYDVPPDLHRRVVARIHAAQRQLWGRSLRWED